MYGRAIVLRFLVVLALATACGCENKVNNVCPTLEDYATIRTNKKCWYNPDVDAESGTITKRYGFHLRNHKVITQDGYILTIHRVVPIDGKPGKTPILMQHGLCHNADFLLIHGNTSTPLYLAGLGYDVWLSNLRGTEASMRHVKMTPADKEFWDFSFHEMGVLDIPAILDYIQKKTGGKKITFIGHSMGATVQYVYASTMPQHAKEHVLAMVSIAPVVYPKHMKTQIAVFLSPFTDQLFVDSGRINFLGSGMYPQIKKITNTVCSSYPYIFACEQLLEIFSGRSLGNLEPEILPLFFKRYPAGFSVKTLVHYGQEINSGGRFQMFDYGPKKNMERYKSEKPLQYDLKKINLPIYIFYGEADLLSVEEDAKLLFEELIVEDKLLMPFRGANNTVKFSHQDFLFSKCLMEFNSFLENLLKNITSKEQNLYDNNKTR